VVLASFTSAGAHRYSKRFGGGQHDVGLALAADGFGNIYLAGSFQGSVDFGGGLHTSAGSTDVFVASYSSTLAHRFSKAFGSTGVDHGTGLAVVGLDLYLAGEFSDTMSLGGAPLTATTNSSDLFVARFGL
jgi:hypothetical protein